MARFRLRLRFNPGRIGAPLDKLGEFAIQTEKFLRSIANDLGVSTKKGEWLAASFSNESVAWDTEYAGRVADDVTPKALHAFAAITGGDPLSACNKGLISYGTLAEFSRIGKAMDPDERFYLGVYETDDANEPHWEEVPYYKIAEIRQFLEAPTVSYGSVQGVMHAWHPGAEPAFFTLRELSSGQLVKCVYSPTKYAQVHDSTKEPKIVMHAYGDIEWDSATSSIVELRVNDITLSTALSDFEFDSIFGSMPHFTGTFSTAEYIAWVRGDGE